MAKSVSLVVPCWNGERYLAEFLSSVLAQTRMPDEFIFVNDGSDDSTEDIFASHKSLFEEKGTICKYIEVEHAGQAKALSAGLKLMTGDYLTWADSDDILHPDAIRAKADFLDTHPEFAWVRNDALYYEEETGTVTGNASLPRDRQHQRLFDLLLTEQTYVLAGCYMMRSSLFLSCYPERTIPDSREGQNLQMLLPPASRAICGYIDETLLTYRIHEGSHAHSARSFTDQIARSEEFANLKKELLTYCDCNQESSNELIDNTLEKAKKAIYFSVAQYHRKQKADLVSKN